MRAVIRPRELRSIDGKTSRAESARGTFDRARIDVDMGFSRQESAADTVGKRCTAGRAESTPRAVLLVERLSSCGSLRLENGVDFIAGNHLITKLQLEA